VGPPGRKRQLGRHRIKRGTILSWTLEKMDEVVYTGLICLRTGTSGKLL
jgi:hypothetical protein